MQPTRSSRHSPRRWAHLTALARFGISALCVGAAGACEAETSAPAPATPPATTSPDAPGLQDRQGGSAADAGCEGASCTPPADGSSPPPPARICNVSDYGAKGDGHTNDAKAIQAAIDACATTGGRVSLENGKFLSGTITLQSDITLEITPSATLLGSQNVADYPDTKPGLDNTQLSNCKKALVYAAGARNVRITGGGTIDGNARGVPDWNGSKIKEALRPMAIFTTLSKNVTVDGITVKDAATWAVVNMEVEHLVIRGITVNTNLGPTHDGIDVVDGRDVLIEDVDVTSGDDSICLKSGSERGLHDVTVRRSRTQQSGVANGVKLGTASVGAFENILVEDIAISNAQAAAMAVESVDGARIANVTFRRITTDNVGTPVFVLLGNRDRDPSRVGSIDGLAFEDITGKNMRYAWGSVITGTTIGDRTFDISNISFKNVGLSFKGAGAPPSEAPFTTDSFPEYQGPVPGQPGKLYNRYPDAKFIAGIDGNENVSYGAPGWAFFVRHANHVTFADCTTTVSKADPRPWLATKDTTFVTGTCSP